MTDNHEVDKFRPTASFATVLGFITANAGLAIFLIYVLIATVGCIYLIVFYARFDLNVVAYLEGSDILVAGIKDPIVLLATIGALAVTGLTWLIAYVQAPLNAWLNKKFNKGFLRIIPHTLGVTSIRSFWWHALATFVVCSYLFIDFHSKGKADSILNEKHGLVTVASDVTSTVTDQYSLLGTSINFVFLYDHLKKNTLILPIENIQSLQPTKAKAKTK